MKSLSGLILFLAAAGAVADTVAVCGASKGYGYYLPKAPTSADESGWTEDSISSGSFQLIRSNDDYDIIIKDSRGGTFSARADGAEVVGMATPDGDVVVHLLYPRLTETYVFWLSLAKPIATLAQTKFATPIPKAALMVAECTKGRS
jgi:hypothetical protein